MDEKEKRKQIRRYFEPRKTPVVLIAMAIIGALGIWFADEANLKLISFALTLPLIALLVYRKMRSRPSHAQVDEWLAEDLGRITDLALSKLDLPPPHERDRQG